MTTDLPRAEGPAGRTLRERLIYEQVRALYANVVIGVLGAAAASVALTVALIRLEPKISLPLIIGWSLIIVVLAAGHIGLRIGFARSATTRDHGRSWALAFTLVSLAEGIAWGWASVALVSQARFDLQLLVFVICFGVAAGAIPAFSAYLPAFAAFFLAATLPLLAKAIETAGQVPTAPIFIAVIIIFVVAMGALGLRLNRATRELINLRIQADDLVAELRRQKDVAEQASLAKSRFLAAASHDLRQPVHALSLFVGALRGTDLPDPSMRLVEHIEASIDGLDSLFSAILDMSRLDAGTVRVSARAFQLHGVLDRICREFAAEADAKGLRLSLVGSKAVVRSDPALLERILRNLISNAVRYTEHGGIVVGCRRRGGSVRIEVWDTGPGIPPDAHDLIFQEYAQIGNPERDRDKGLGLGLAIVRRLSDLLDAPVELRSRVDHGSCFSVRVPIARRDADQAPEAGSHRRDEGSRRITIVDDDRAIREGMNTLLSGWGYAVTAAESADALLADPSWRDHGADLILCDYRLRGGENGIEAIARLRAVHDVPPPAVLITGDTAPDRLHEARARGLLVLHKPVPNGKLRASITNLLAASTMSSSARTMDDAQIKP